MSIVTLTIQTTDAAARSLVADLDGSPRTLGTIGSHYPTSTAVAATLGTRQVPTYHGIQFAQCFACGYATADTDALEAWSDETQRCPGCGDETRVMWVLTGGRALVSLPLDAGGGGYDLRIGRNDGTPPDAPGTITGPELDANDWPAHDFVKCMGHDRHVPTARHPESDCRRTVTADWCPDADTCTDPAHA